MMDESVDRWKIAFITADDPLDRRVRSGTPYCMVRALEKHCGEVVCLGPVRPPEFAAGKALDALTRRILKRRYMYLSSAPLSRAYARVFARRLSKRPFDLVVAVKASTEIAYLKTDIPIVYISDATFELMLDKYPAFSGLLDISRREGERLEAMAIHRARLALYPSRWAALSAVEHYGADPDKVEVINSGANLEGLPSRDEALARSPGDRCRLLFVGVDWERKGGPIALEALRYLSESGLPVELTICGSDPPAAAHLEGVRVIPYLDKNDPGQSAELNRLYMDSDFLLLPTRAECFGIAQGEACAFGLPVISTEVGGVPDAIEHGKSGYLLPPEAGGKQYAELIRDIFHDEERYRELARAARDAFEQRLNWDRWAQRLKEVVRPILTEGRAPV